MALAVGSINAIAGEESFLGKAVDYVGASKILKMLLSIMGYFLFALLIPAMALAFYIPFVPLLLWTIALVQLFIVTVEAVIAGPIWAVAHISQRGVKQARASRAPA